VSFVFEGAAPERDGSDIFLLADRMDQSFNAQLMRQGHAYPAYYAPRGEIGGLPWDLRERLTQLADIAWMADRGVWDVDASRSNPRIRDNDELTELAIWPKLYRRLAKYFDEGHAGLRGFVAWLTDPNHSRDDHLLILTNGQHCHLHNVLEVRGNRIDMNRWPEELLIYPR
jgi:hypothetical protein